MKSVVTDFNPKCIVTDGALYIDDGFKEAIGKEARDAVHIVCWWHQRENVLKKIGIKKELGRVLLRMAYARSKKDITALKRRAEAIATKDVEILALESYKKMIKNCAKNALFCLKVFTGGTVTNSFSESMNNLLRRAELNPKYPMLTILRYIDNFTVQHNCPKHHRFPSSFESLSVLEDEVLDKLTVGALCKCKRIVQNRIKQCQLVRHKGKLCVREERVIRYWEQLHLRRLRGRWRGFDNTAYWEVKHSKDGFGFECSCNAPIYSGMPCPHIFLYAEKMHKKIPVSSFNSRFYIPDDTESNDDQPSISLPEPEEGDDNMDKDMCSEEAEDSCVQDSEQIQTDTVCKVSKLKLDTLDEITLYEQLRKVCVDLTGLYAMPEWTEQASEIKQWCLQASDGLVLGCMSSVTTNITEENAGAVVLNGIQLKTDLGNAHIKRICDNIHIADATMDSTFASPEMCEFRGHLMGVMIKIILVHRVKPDMVLFFNQELQKQVSCLLEKSRTARTTRVASLKPTYGILSSDSYINIPTAVAEFCKKSLIEASNRGVRLSVLLKASDCNKSAKPPARSKKRSRTCDLTPIHPRKRLKSSLYTFLPGP